MKRRDVLIATAAFAATLPVVTRAQQPRRIGLLRLAPADAEQLADFRRGLQETGYAEGRNLVIEYRFADGDYHRLPELATDLVRQNVEVIMTSGRTRYGKSCDECDRYDPDRGHERCPSR